MVGLCGSRCVILRETCIAVRERARLISRLELTDSALEADLITRLTTLQGDDVIVPTNSLYIIKTIVGTHPLLKDFQLSASGAGRQEAQAEVRHAELENIRLAARALNRRFEDPDIEKKIVIKTDNKKGVTVQADGN